MTPKEIYQKVNSLRRLVRTDCFGKQDGILDFIILALIFINPRMGGIRFLKHKRFWEGGITAEQLSKISHASVNSVQKFEKQCFQIRRARLRKVDSDLARVGFSRVRSMNAITRPYVNFFQNKFAATGAWNAQVPAQGNIFRHPSPSHSYWSFDIQDWQIPLFSQILSCSELRAALSEYFGSEYFLYSVNNLVTLPSAVRHPVQNWHRDHDTEDFLVLFIYWSSLDSGSTTYLLGSHLRDDQKENFDLVETSGSAGSGYLIDTFGYHCGKVPTAGARYVTWFRFSPVPINSASFYDGQLRYFNLYQTLLGR